MNPTVIAPFVPSLASWSATLLARGIDRLNAGKFVLAEAMFRELLAQDPHHREAHHQLGVTLARQSRYAQAEAALGAALALGESGPCWRDLGWVLLWQGRDEEAIAAYRKAIAAGVREARLFVNLGNLFRKARAWPEAETCYREAIAVEPASAAAWSNLALLQQDAGRFAEAEASLRQSLTLDPRSAHVWHCYGNLLLSLNRLDEADEAYCRGGRWASAQYVRRCAAHWHQLPRIDAAAVEMIAAGDADDAMPAALLGIARLAPARLREAGRRFAESRWRGELAAPPLVARGAGLAEALAALGRGAPLRVGYLARSFDGIAGVLEHHDPARFEIHLYGPKDAEERLNTLLATAPSASRLPATAHDIGALSDAGAAARIARDGLHLLVDLEGYAEGARLGIAARRPAPLIVRWLGYPGSLGHPRLADYLIGDATATPPETAGHYSETLALMPHCHLPGGHRRALPRPPSRAEAGLPATGIVFCCFNRTFKLAAPMFALWCRLLAAVPGSVLWLRDPGSALAQTNLRVFMEEHGIDAARLVFAPRVPDEAQLARLQLADCALDTLPACASTSGREALWAGVPLVSVAGDRFAGRVSASLLAALGLPALVARDLEAYFQTALAIACDPAWRDELRDALARARYESPVFDAEPFARDLEKLYLGIVAAEAARAQPALRPVVEIDPH